MNHDENSQITNLIVQAAKGSPEERKFATGLLFECFERFAKDVANDCGRRSSGAARAKDSEDIACESLYRLLFEWIGEGENVPASRADFRGLLRTIINGKTIDNYRKEKIRPGGESAFPQCAGKDQDKEDALHGAINQVASPCSVEFAYHGLEMKEENGQQVQLALEAAMLDACKTEEERIVVDEWSRGVEPKDSSLVREKKCSVRTVQNRLRRVADRLLEPLRKRLQDHIQSLDGEGAQSLAEPIVKTATSGSKALRSLGGSSATSENEE